jgi:hypothetical protein
VRSDVAIPRSAPRRRGAPDAFGAAKLLYEKTAGCSCLRRARTVLSQHDRRHRLAAGSLGQGAPSNEPPAPSRPTPGRDIRLPPEGEGQRPRIHFGPRLTPAPEQTQAHRRAGLRENGLASRLEDRIRRAEARPTLAFDAEQSTLGRVATIRGFATLDAIPAGQGLHRGRGPTLPRTGKTLTRIHPAKQSLRRRLCEDFCA